MDEITEGQQIIDALGVIHVDLLGVRSDLSWVIFFLAVILTFTVCIAACKR